VDWEVMNRSLPINHRLQMNWKTQHPECIKKYLIWQQSTGVNYILILVKWARLGLKTASYCIFRALIRERENEVFFCHVRFVALKLPSFVRTNIKHSHRVEAILAVSAFFFKKNLLSRLFKWTHSLSLSLSHSSVFPKKTILYSEGKKIVYADGIFFTIVSLRAENKR